MDRKVEVVAHRAGNTPELARVADLTDRVEVDVHVFRGRVEVRHAKVLWPFARQWEKWHLLPRGTRSPALVDQLASARDDVPLLLDLKVFTRRAARRIRDVVPADRSVVIASRSWWALGAFADRTDVLRLRSCGNRLQLAMAMRLRRWGPTVGLAVHERLVSPVAARRIRQLTNSLYCWGTTIDLERALGLIGAGVQGLIIDDLDVAAQLRSMVESDDEIGTADRTSIRER